MSNSPEFTPIPAFEFLKARYNPEEAEKCYETMTYPEKETTLFITHQLNIRLEATLSNSDWAKSLSPALVLDNDTFAERRFALTNTIKNYFIALGYVVELLPSFHFSGLAAPVLIVRWC